MRYWTRKDIMLRLGLSQSASYRIVGTSRGKNSLISSADLLAILNNARRGAQPMLAEVPGDIVTGEEMAKELQCVTARQLKNWTLRLRNPLPHFLLNTHCRRYQKSAVLKWLDNFTQIVRRG